MSKRSGEPTGMSLVELGVKPRGEKSKEAKGAETSIEQLLDRSFGGHRIRETVEQLADPTALLEDFDDVRQLDAAMVAIQHPDTSSVRESAMEDVRARLKALPPGTERDQKEAELAESEKLLALAERRTDPIRNFFDHVKQYSEHVRVLKEGGTDEEKERAEERAEKFKERIFQEDVPALDSFDMAINLSGIDKDLTNPWTENLGALEDIARTWGGLKEWSEMPDEDSGKEEVEKTLKAVESIERELARADAKKFGEKIKMIEPKIRFAKAALTTTKARLGNENHPFKYMGVYDRKRYRAALENIAEGLKADADAFFAEVGEAADKVGKEINKEEIFSFFDGRFALREKGRGWRVVDFPDGKNQFLVREIVELIENGSIDIPALPDATEDQRMDIAVLFETWFREKRKREDETRAGGDKGKERALSDEDIAKIKKDFSSRLGIVRNEKAVYGFELFAKKHGEWLSSDDVLRDIREEAYGPPPSLEDVSAAQMETVFNEWLEEKKAKLPKKSKDVVPDKERTLSDKEIAEIKKEFGKRLGIIRNEKAAAGFEIFPRRTSDVWLSFNEVAHDIRKGLFYEPPIKGVSRGQLETLFKEWFEEAKAKLPPPKAPDVEPKRVKTDYSPGEIISINLTHGIGETGFAPGKFRIVEIDHGGQWVRLRKVEKGQYRLFDLPLVAAFSGLSKKDQERWTNEHILPIKWIAKDEKPTPPPEGVPYEISDDGLLWETVFVKEGKPKPAAEFVRAAEGELKQPAPAEEPEPPPVEPPAVEEPVIEEAPPAEEPPVVSKRGFFLDLLRKRREARRNR